MKSLKRINYDMKRLVIRIIVFACLSAIFCTCGFVFRAQIESFLNGTQINYDKSLIDTNGLVVHYIDVKQADCTLIELPDGKKMLIDAGERNSQDNMIEYINQNIFDSNGEDEPKVIDYVLLTHSDTDHCGGMKKIFEEYQVSCVFRPQIYISQADKNKDFNAPSMASFYDGQIYTETINAMYDEPDCEVIFTTASALNTTYKIESESAENYYEFYFFTPTKNSYQEVNDYSPIMTLTYNSRVFMFTGDATEKTEKEALENSSLGKVDVLKVAHHGSSTSSSQAFLEKIYPKYAIIQVGKNNQYNHPTEKVLERLKSVNSEIFRTDKNQNIVANVDTLGSLKIYADISNAKIKVLYLIVGIEMILIYFCFFVKTKNKKSK